MSLKFPTGKYDVVVTLEVLSHVSDQAGFVGKIASLLKPGGYLMMATQNKFVLDNFNNVPPPTEGQLRHWVDRNELEILLTPDFDVESIFTVTPKANRGFMRAVNSYKVNLLVRKLFGNRFDRLKESLGLGWTLMALARKK